MSEKTNVDFYGAGLSLVVGYLLIHAFHAVMDSIDTYVFTNVLMTPGEFTDLLQYTLMSLWIATFLCTGIFLAIGFYKKSETLPFILAILSTAFAIGVFIPEILIYGDFVAITSPYTQDPTVLSNVILNGLFWLTFLILVILSAITLNRETENKIVKDLRMAFFILFGLTLASYFLSTLYPFISFNIEGLTTYLTFINVFYYIEFACAIGAGILFIVSARQK